MVVAAFKDVFFLGCFVLVLFILGDIAQESLSFPPTLSVLLGRDGAFCANLPWQ